jgi:hypothetical protein
MKSSKLFLARESRLVTSRLGMGKTITIFYSVYRLRRRRTMKRKVVIFCVQLMIIPWVAPYLLGLIHIALTGSVYTTIAVAMERCVTVCAPFTDIRVGKQYSAFLATFCIAIKHGGDHKVRIYKEYHSVLYVHSSELGLSQPEILLYILYSRFVIPLFSHCTVGEGTMEYTKLRFPEQGQCF